ncbi:hypothetical protein 1 [Wenzhou picorna-like virus 9]|uniref:hypothetical protein 1 n=1 Tax=Wenzhou picorna-like virus 9 TaxID=1923646 RepID=UPI00090CB578|nr:hypothetical protein 1 [Wenzhou picorna-like virus 9]APG78555.1 hypothetical protein 1 [Wenzhou picorna-like virus 9]
MMVLSIAEGNCCKDSITINNHDWLSWAVIYCASVCYFTLTISLYYYKNTVFVSQSSQEVNDWHEQRRGNYNRKKKNHQKAMTRKADKKKIYKPSDPGRPKDFTLQPKIVKKSQSGESDDSESDNVNIWTLLNQLRDFLKIPASFTFVDENIQLVRKSKVWESFLRLFNIITSFECFTFIRTYMWASELITSTHIRGRPKISEVLEIVREFKDTLVDCFYAYREDGNVASFFRSAKDDTFEQEFTFLVAHYPILDSGRSLMCPQAYDRRLDDILMLISEKLIATSSNGERAVLMRQMQEIKNLQTKRTLAKRGHRRITPYGILLYGRSGTGKSSIANVAIRTLLASNGYDATDESVVTLNESDKYQSEFRTHHTGVIFDDLSQGAPSKTTENPLLRLFQFSSSVPMSAINAVAEQKGNIMIEPKVLLATTNTKHLHADTYVSDTEAALRRFNIIATQRVRKEYADFRGMVDKRKVPVLKPGELPDIYEFDLETVVRNKNDKFVRFIPLQDATGKDLKNIGLREFLEFACDDSRFHFQSEKLQVKLDADKPVVTLCKCSYPTNICKCSSDQPKELDSQAGYFSLLGILVLLERKICSLIENSPPYKTFISYCAYQTLLSEINQTYLMCVFLASLLLLLFCVDIGFITLTQALSSFLIAVVVVYNTMRLQLHSIKQDMRRRYAVPRPFAYLHSFDVSVTTQIMAMIIAIVSWMILKPKKRISQSFDSIRSESAEPLHFWGKQLFEKYLFRTKFTDKNKTTSSNQLTNIVKTKQMMLKIATNVGTHKFCNLVPIRGNVVAIPAHIIPDKRTSVVVVKQQTFDTRATIEPSCTYRIPGTDIALWYCPELGVHKDMTEYMGSNIERGKQFPINVIYFTQDRELTITHTLATRGLSRTTLGGTFESLEYGYKGKTFNGLCMATCVATTEGKSFIAGYHLAGKDSLGAAGFITREQILAGLEQLEADPGILLSHCKQDFPKTIAGVPLSVKEEEIHPLSVFNDLPNDSKVEIIGSHGLPSSTWTSRVEPTIITSHVEKIMNLPALHGKPKDMADQRHKRVDVEKKVNTAYNFDQDIVRRSVVDYSIQIFEGLAPSDLKGLRPLTMDECLSGVDGERGVNAMEFSTSAGYPFKGKKDKFVIESERKLEHISYVRDLKPIIAKEVTFMEEELASGRRINTVFRAALKDEPTKFTKDKVRVFGCCNMPFTIVVRKYFLKLSALMQQRQELFECAVGINVDSPEWHDLILAITKYGSDRMVAGDYASFDSQMSVRFMLAAFKILINIAERSGNFSPRELIIMSGVATEICYPTYDHFGTLATFFGSNPSGHPLTVVINSIVNSLYMRYCFFTLGEKHNVRNFSSVVSLMTYGDDNVMSVKQGYEWFNHTAIAKVLSDAGIKYTMADKTSESVPFIDLSEVSFLKHVAVWDEDLQIYRAKIEEDSIAKMLHSHVKSEILPNDLHSAEAVSNAAQKYFGFGREVYDQRIEQLYQVAEAAGITGLVGDLKTYDERLRAFKEKYEDVLSSQEGENELEEAQEVSILRQIFKILCVYTSCFLLPIIIKIVKLNVEKMYEDGTIRKLYEHGKTLKSTNEAYEYLLRSYHETCLGQGAEAIDNTYLAILGGLRDMVMDAFDYAGAVYAGARDANVYETPETHHWCYESDSDSEE